MITSVQSAAPTNPILPMQPADAPNGGDFKLALDHASETQAPAKPNTEKGKAANDKSDRVKSGEVKSDGVQSDELKTKDVNPKEDNAPESVQDGQHGKTKKDKQDECSPDNAAPELRASLQMLVVPTPPPVNASQVVSLPKAVSQVTKEPLAAVNMVPESVSSATKVEEPQATTAAVDGSNTEAASKKAPSFIDGLSLPVNESSKLVSPAADAAEAKNSPVTGEQKPEHKAEATKTTVNVVVSKGVESLPISSEKTDATQPAGAQPAPAQSIPEALRHIPTPASPAVAQTSQPEADQPVKTVKPRAVQHDGQSSAVGSQYHQSGVQQAAEQGDNKNDSSPSTKSSSDEGAGADAKSEGKKTEAGFDPQAGALAAARQTVSREPANTVQAASHSQAAAGAAIPAARQFQTTPNISSAQLVQTMNGAEMRVGLHSAEFGNIAIHTAIENGNVSANISVEHSSLGKAVADQLPALASKLHDEQGLRTQINIQDQSAGFSGEARQQQSQEYQQSPTSNAVKMPFQVERATSTTSVSTAAAVTTNGRLSIRI